MTDSQLVDEMMAHLEPKPENRDLDQYDPDSNIAKFYSNKSVFITGATGFIGKALIEKLIRSCKEIGRIFVLIREKRGKLVNERLDDLIQSQFFDKIRLQQNGQQLLKKKLRVIKGDITQPQFGIVKSDLDMLSEEIEIVFNSAATVRFVEPIDSAVRLNIQSLAHLVEFCDQLKNLKALVHLSTAYSNCHKRDTIYEILYDPPMRGSQIIKAVEDLKKVQDCMHRYKASDGPAGSKERSASLRTRNLQRFYDPINESNADDGQSEDSLDLMTQFSRIALRTSNKPNTYTFTKAISETYLLDLLQERPHRYLGEGRISVAIVRPSIVGSCWREPLVGYVDNFNGSTGVISALYTGAMQIVAGDPNLVTDIVPIDMVVNMVLSVGWFLVTASDKTDTIKSDQGVFVFNFVSGYRNPTTQRQLVELVVNKANQYPTKLMVRLPNSCFIRAGKLYDMFDLINQKFPALIQDFIRGTVLGQSIKGRAGALTTYKRVRQMTNTLTPFWLNQWLLCDRNTCALYDKLDERDQHLFNFNVCSINWTEYLGNYAIGSRIYALRDAANTVPAAMRMINKRRTINTAMITILLLSFYYFFCRQSKLEFYILDSLPIIGF